MSKGSSAIKGIGSFILTIFVAAFAKTCTKEMFNAHKSSYDYSINQTNTSYQKTSILKSEDVFEIPEGWTKYTIDNASFTISLPTEKLELRHDYDVYTKFLKENGYACNTDAVVFQQKGLADKEQEATEHYGRVMLTHFVGDAGDFMKASETEPLDANAKTTFWEMVKSELGPYKLIGEPSYEWLYINDIRAVEIRYRREGSNGNTSTRCAIYLLFNYDEMVKMIVSFREEERDYWLPDMENIIMTFKWL